MKKLFMRLIVIAGLLVSPALSTATVAAASPLSQAAVCTSGAGNFFGFQPWYACLPGGDTGQPRLTKLTDVFLVLFPVVDSLVKVAVLVAAGYVFFMLFKMATANGNSSTVATALGGMRDAVVGLIIAMVSVAIVNFIAGAFV